MLYQPYRSLLALLVVLFFYNGSTEPDVQVTGTWEAGFSGKVQGKGTSQDDMLVLELTQDGSAVKGTLRFMIGVPARLLHMERRRELQDLAAADVAFKQSRAVRRVLIRDENRIILQRLRLPIGKNAPRRLDHAVGVVK